MEELMQMGTSLFYTFTSVGALVAIGFLILLIRMFQKIDQGTALVRNGMGGAKVAFSGMFVVPILHRSETMDISLKRIEIERSGQDGLICSDNMRADIKVAFFVRVNKTVDDVLKVAQAIGCSRASDTQELINLFDAKFSEALKTVGKRFAFTELYTERENFKNEILQVIGTDLNGFVMDDAAIDYLEQTPLDKLDPDHILDSQGIKKITEITAEQKILANKIAREKEKTITQQNVEAKEAVLELNRQLTEAEEKQKREVENVKARESAETEKVAHEEMLKSEMARIKKEEEIQIAEENKNRQIIVAQKNKERTEVLENERVDKDRLLEVNEKERIVDLAKIEKEKAIEEEQKNIQEVIRERVMVQNLVVEEEEKIKTTQLLAGANREKDAALVNASKEAEEAKIREVKQAEASMESSKMIAEQQIIEAEADQKSAEKKAEAMRTIAEAKIVEESTSGLAEAQVMEAQAAALETKGTAEASVLEKKAIAEAKGIEVNAAAEAKGIEANAVAQAKGVEANAVAKAKGIEVTATAKEKDGLVEATVLEKKAVAEAKGIEANAEAKEKMGEAEATVMTKKSEAEALGIEKKAEAMKKMDGVGKEHEEFKLRLKVDKEVKLAEIQVQADIASSQAAIVAEALKSAKIDIVGGEVAFFDKIIGSITQAKTVDRLVHNSDVLTDVKETFFTGNPDDFAKNLRQFVQKFGITSQELKDLSISALLLKLSGLAQDDATQGILNKVKQFVLDSNMGDMPASIINTMLDK